MLKKIIMLYGNSLSGKTSLALKIQEKTGINVFSIDDYRREYSDGTIEGEYLAWEKLFDNIEREKIVILDSTGLSKQLNNNIISGCLNLNIILVCPVKELYKRLSDEIIKQRKSIPYPYKFTSYKESIKRMQSLLPKRGDLIFDSFALTIDQITNLIIHSEKFKIFINQSYERNTFF